MSKDIFRRLMLRIKENLPSVSDAIDVPFKPWGWSLPLLLVLTIGWFGMTCHEVWLERGNAQNRIFIAEHSPTIFVQGTAANNMTAFLRHNPFRISPMPNPERYAAPQPPPRIMYSLAAASLTGTSPGLMAWLEYQGALRLISIGNSFGAYTLEDVTHYGATFARGEERVMKLLLFGNRAGRSSVVSLPPQPSAGDMVAAAGQAVSPRMAGVISRVRVNELLENPFDELRNIRFRPLRDGHGVQVQWLNNSSIFAQIGVQRNDVIQGVNGVAFDSAVDINNALNSLMTGDHFAVEVKRNGALTVLHYEVR